MREALPPKKMIVEEAEDSGSPDEKDFSGGDSIKIQRASRELGEEKGGPEADREAPAVVSEETSKSEEAENIIRLR